MMRPYLVTSILFDGHLALEWEECPLPDSVDRQRLEAFLLETSKHGTPGTAGGWLVGLGLSDEEIPLSPSLEFWRRFAAAWVRQVRADPACETKREAFSVKPDGHDLAAFLEEMPLMAGIDRAGEEVLGRTWNLLNHTFQAAIEGFKGSVEGWFESVSPVPRNVDRIHFHLVENRKNTQRPFAFLATYTSRIDKEGRVRHAPLRAALAEYGEDRKKLLDLLSTVKRVARRNALIASFEESGDLFNPIELTPAEALAFLNGVAVFEEAGILCRIPRWWKGARTIAVTLSVGANAPSKIGSAALLEFNAGLQLDGETISEAETRRILDESEGLALIKGKWVAVDTASLRKTLDLLEQARKLSEKERLSFADAMRMLMGATPASGPALSGVEVTSGAWLKSVLEKMSNPALIRETAPSSSLRAMLRPYQRQGLNWLYFLHSLGFGICLADDMGLGKTVQVLALLQKIKHPDGCSLIVVPASLLENWRLEIEKFTPDLKAVIIHPQAPTTSPLDAIGNEIERYDIVITTYGMVKRLAWLAAHEWLYVICDEAQAIKNPTTDQTRAVKSLICKHRLAMTGTPVENRLTDLWSLFDFINPGLLGTFVEFKRFIKGLDDHPEGYGRLRRVVHPYILRRSKSDKSIIADLPEKVEMKTYCTLSRVQTVLYRELVKRLEGDLADAEGIKRKGIVLGYLMKCKQLCNHPDHYAGSGHYNRERSGKFNRLAELCETIREKREKTLVFTQFAEIIDPLASFLASLFGVRGLTLSGSSSIRQRREAVDRFQNGTDYTPFFILSLKAGGTGLNLTAANHVIHFDRWWNPAVENQATDRAYRIGQKKKVIVHKFICKGTVEEKIDELIEDKKKLAGEIIPSSAENWITELDDRRLKNLFRLTMGAEENE
jgi:non-specific serine/threonine protein kinase